MQVTASLSLKVMLALQFLHPEHWDPQKAAPFVSCGNDGLQVWGCPANFMPWDSVPIRILIRPGPQGQSRVWDMLSCRCLLYRCKS